MSFSTNYNCIAGGNTTCNCGLYNLTTVRRMSPNEEFSGPYTAAQAKSSAGKDAVAVLSPQRFDDVEIKSARQTVNIDPAFISPEESKTANTL